jgi:hypothetical protein
MTVTTKPINAVTADVTQEKVRATRTNIHIIGFGKVNLFIDLVTEILVFDF